MRISCWVQLIQGPRLNSEDFGIVLRSFESYAETKLRWRYFLVSVQAFYPVKFCFNYVSVYLSVKTSYRHNELSLKYILSIIIKLKEWLSNIINPIFTQNLIKNKICAISIKQAANNIIETNGLEKWTNVKNVIFIIKQIPYRLRVCINIDYLQRWNSFLKKIIFFKNVLLKIIDRLDDLDMKNGKRKELLFYFESKITFQFCTVTRLCLPDKYFCTKLVRKLSITISRNILEG